MKDKLYIPNKKIIQQQIDVLEDQKYKLDLMSKYPNFCLDFLWVFYDENATNKNISCFFVNLRMQICNLRIAVLATYEFKKKSKKSNS